MEAKDAKDFKHTTLARSPIEVVGVTLRNEGAGLTGIYLRDAAGGLWPARTVNRANVAHHESVVSAWMGQPGTNLDERVCEMIEPHGRCERVRYCVEYRADRRVPSCKSKRNKGRR